MGVVESWTFTRANMEDLADDIKAIVVSGLVREKMLNDESGNEWCKSHTIIIREKSFFRTLFEKVIKSDEKDNMGFIIVKKV